MSSTTTTTTATQHAETTAGLQLPQNTDDRAGGPSMDITTSRSGSQSPSRNNSLYSDPQSGLATPDPLLYRHALSRRPSRTGESDDEIHELDEIRHPHLGDAFEKLSRAISNSSAVEDSQPVVERFRSSSRRGRRMTPSVSDGRRPSNYPSRTTEEGQPVPRKSQGIPPELRNLPAELVFVTVCSAGQLLFAILQGNINVNQTRFQTALALPQGSLPWLPGAFLTALGLSVIISGSLTDLLPPKALIVGSFIWLTIWNVIGAFALTPSRAILFFVMRAMQGLAVGVLVSGSMSVLGRIYNPGLRKTRVFSAMAAAAPFGFWLGALQGGALSSHLEWIFGSTAIICGLCAVAAYATIPALKPVADVAGKDAPTLRSFDWKGALLAVGGCICLLFGLTQGSVAHWAPYTYTLIIIGILLLTVFFFVETKVARPLIPSTLWKTPGFAPLMLAYFLGFGGFVGAWQFYAVQFFLNQQHVSSLTVALYLLPNAIFGVLATFIVSRLMHRISGHWIFLASQIAFAMGPAFFLPQKPSTNYFALSMPGIALATFGPDLSFAAASIYITSSVARSYQGSAGSLLVTIQNLSSAIMTSVADSIAAKVDSTPDGGVGLEGLRAAWWLALGASLVGAVVTAVWVRIPKEEEKEHVS